MPKCRYLHRPGGCDLGCTPRNILCHHWEKYRKCDMGDSCSRGRHSAPPPLAPPPRATQKEIDLTLLGLNSSGCNVTGRLVNAAFKVRSVVEHPDHAAARGGDRAEQTRIQQELLNAKDRLVLLFPAI